MIFDVIIIGGGAAGLSTALWCAELGLSAVLLEAREELGGQLLRVYNPIKNHLGVEAENGRELRDIFAKQIENYDFTVRLKAQVSRINFKTKTVLLEGGEELSARTIVVATGVKRRKLNVEGEAEFTGRGILESGKREQLSVKGKTIVVVGGGDAALENALILADAAEKVTIVYRGKRFRAREEFIEKVRSNSKIEILTETNLTKINGVNRVETVELQNSTTNETKILPAEAILIRIGVEPNTQILCDELNLDENDYVKIDNRCETSVRGVFAVGDVANPVSPTISTAVGTGATAAKAIFESLKQSKKLASGK